MTLLNRFIPLVVAVLMSACINVPEVGDPLPNPEVPDGGTKPDGGVPADSTPPTLTATVPTHGSTNVTTSPQFQFTFSEPMNVGTVQVSIAPMVALSTGVWTSNNTQLTLQPLAALAQNTTYMLSVDGKDVAGNALTDRKQFSFETTGPAPDTTPPTILAISPSYGAIGVAQSATFTVTFSEPMDKASAQTAFAITSPSGFNAGVFTWSAEGTVMTFNPDTDFPYGTTVGWQVSMAAKDLAGNTLESATAASFRAIRVNTVTIDFDPYTSGSALAPDYARTSALYNLENVGDNTQNREVRLFIGFKLDVLPENLARIADCRLKWFTSSQQGSPFSSLGRLLLERVFIGESIAFSTTDTTNPSSKGQYESAALGSPIIVLNSAIPATLTSEVTSLVALDWLERTNRNSKRSQFRLRFEVPSNNDGLRDTIVSDVEQTPKLAELLITYEYP
ncbi:Ig-like domain-containing protein [Hyalangium minutum]|uniref:SbsA Ig-like domain-containing protein n=1 Tax=Hyalangium minutum TaxID=394096 RepID=A0A085WHB9_9BACT|nr:Ig-like domain-containing protein [Hyalangium minutum]KFE67082.1 hypothetical protein DB31_8435 [Hyalangium minutum]